MIDNNHLVDYIKERSISYIDNQIRDEKVLTALRRVDRKNFLPNQVKDLAYNDAPVPIGYNQTCSQPSMVAFMLDKLDIHPGHKILEIGAGCGYAAAVASLLCLPDGIIYASEIIPDLAFLMQRNLAAYQERIVILPDDGSCGFQEYAPFDRIFISAGINSHNFKADILLSQLTDHGILLYPESYGNIYQIKKIDGRDETMTYYGVSFVPLVGRNS